MLAITPLVRDTRPYPTKDLSCLCAVLETKRDYPLHCYCKSVFLDRPSLRRLEGTMHVDIPIRGDMRVGVTDYIMLLLLARI